MICMIQKNRKIEKGEKLKTITNPGITTFPTLFESLIIAKH